MRWPRGRATRVNRSTTEFYPFSPLQRKTLHRAQLLSHPVHIAARDLRVRIVGSVAHGAGYFVARLCFLERLVGVLAVAEAVVDVGRCGRSSPPKPT